MAVDYLEKMANCVDNAGADLALCGFHHLFEGADIPKSPRSGVWELQHFKEMFLELYSMSYLNMPWNKLYRKDLMGTFDTSLSLGEDLLFNLDGQTAPDRRPQFLALMFLFLSAMFVIVTSDNLEWLFCGWEITRCV